MSPAEERELLIAAAQSAHRQRDVAGNVVVSGAWLDLDAAGREEAFAGTVALRAVERAAHADGRSSTVRAVLARLRGSNTL